MPLNPILEEQQRLTEVKRRDAERAHDSADRDLKDMNQSAINTGTFAIKMALLINGGAAVAMLTFLGNLVEPTSSPLKPQIKDLANSLSWFASGVGTGALSATFAYFANYFAAEQFGSVAKFWDHPFVRETAAAPYWYRCRLVAQWLATICGVASAILFIIGILQVKDAIGRL